MLARWIVVLCVVAACRDKPTRSVPRPTAQVPTGARPVLTDAGAGATPGADPWAPIDAAPDTPERRRARVEAALGRVPKIIEDVSKLRELAVLRDVASAYQTDEDHRAVLRREIAKQLPPRRSASLSAAMFHMGFLATRVDIATAATDAHATQVAAYYDPEQQKFFVLSAPDDDSYLDMLCSHELTHALQDQHFDLRAYTADLDPPNSDAQIARRFVGEGDATYTMFLYAVTARLPPGMSNEWFRRQVRDAIDKYAEMSPEDAMAAIDANGVSADPEEQKQREARGAIPPIVLVPMFESYFQGARLVMLAHDRGGWAAVDELFRAPPESTEQVLHPATKLFGTREHPRKVTVAPIAGAKKIDEDTIGELGWYIYFSLWASAARVPASEGWGGDRYWVGKRRDGRIIAAIVTTWDTVTDARDFADGYRLSLDARFPHARRTPDGGFVRPDGGKIYVFESGRDVYIVDGSGDPRVLRAVIDGATIEE